MEGLAVWVLGLTFGFCWFPFKLYEWLRPEKITRRDRVNERIAVPVGLGLLVLIWVYFGKEILSKGEGYQFFLGATIGVTIWGLVVLSQLSQPLPEPDLLDTSRCEVEPEAEPKAPTKTYAIDGNNIARVNNGFSMNVVSVLARTLVAEGHGVHVFFDANIGYLSKGAGHTARGDGPLSLGELADLLSLPESSMTVVPGGTTADVWILRWAKHSNALIVTNDRYADHLEDFQEFDEELDRVTLTLIGNHIWLSDRKQPISMDM
jgi:hypothetical protein